MEPGRGQRHLPRGAWGTGAAAGPVSLPWAMVTRTSPPWALREGDVDESSLRLPGLLSTDTRAPGSLVSTGGRVLASLWLWG